MIEPTEAKEITEIEGVDGCLLKWQLTQNDKGEWLWKWVRQPSSYLVIKPLQAKSYQAIKEKATDFELPLTWALDKRREYLQDIIERNEKAVMGSIKKLSGSDEFYLALIHKRIVDASKVIKNAQFELQRLSPNWRPKKNGLDDEMIERAREYTLKSLLPNPVRHNMTLCPFHEDHTPSMSVKGNYVHCFSCNKGWNSIDFVMASKGYDFKEAVKYLNEI